MKKDKKVTADKEGQLQKIYDNAAGMADFLMRADRKGFGMGSLREFLGEWEDWSKEDQEAWDEHFGVEKTAQQKTAQQTLDNLDSIANYFFSLPEENLRQLTLLQETLSQHSSNPEADPAIQNFIGSAHGFMDDTKSFVRTLGIVIGKLRGAIAPPVQNQAPLAANPSENQALYAKRIAQVSGEELKEKELDPIFKKKWDSKLAPGVVYQSMEPFIPEGRENKHVGAGYDSSFLAEEIIRRSRGGNQLGAPYQSIEEAFEGEVGKDPDISKEQKEEVIKILASMGYNIKSTKESDNKVLY